MKFIHGKVVYELEDCVSCSGSGKYPSDKPCPACKGTRRGPKGGKDSCRQCYNGTVADFVNLRECGGCNGTGSRMENRYSHVPDELMQTLPYEVSHSPVTSQTFNEGFLGAGYVTSCTDYGRSAAYPDDKMIHMVKTEKHVISTQALNICDKQDNLCKALVIRRNTGGYTVKARF